MAIADLPFLQALGDGGSRPLTQMVVIHATDNTAAAAAEASYATRREDRTSAHVYVDDNEAYRALPLGNIAYGCFPMGNLRSVQFELVGLSNQISDATMRKAAPLVAEVCRLYGLPVRKVSASELVAGAKGICGHGDVTDAWRQGDHTDPGPQFPWDTFIGYVNGSEDDLDAKQDASLKWIDGRLASLADMQDVYLDPAGKQHPAPLVKAVKALVSAAAADEARDAAAIAAVNALAAHITAAGGSIDAAPIVAAVQAAAADARSHIDALHAELAETRRRLAEALAAG